MFVLNHGGVLFIATMLTWPRCDADGIDELVKDICIFILITIMKI